MPLSELPSPSKAAGATPLQISGSIDAAQTYTDLHLSDGRTLRIETSLLLPEKLSVVVTNPEQTPGTVIPILQEELVVGKRTVETERVRLEKTVQQHEESVDVPLCSTSYEIERIQFNKPVSQAPEVRHEGDTTVYPIVEERIVLTKQVFLKEEIRVTRRVTERIETQMVTLRREELSVQRDPLEGQKST